MSIQNNILPDNPNIEVIKAKQTGLFTNYIYKAIPLAFDESMSYYETLCGLLNYLKNTILPTLNNNADAVSELQNLYIELKTYVDDYFTDLDVQEEINNKLDKMAQDGTITNLIKEYIDPLYQAYETEINEIIENQNTSIANQNLEISNFKSSVNSQIGHIDNKVNSATSGSPKGVYASVSALTTADPNHDYIYVVTETGKWYYYNTTESEWVAGGDYQTPLNEYDYTLSNDNEVPNSKTIGDKLNKNVFSKNYFNVNDYTDNYYINDSGVETSNNSYLITNFLYLKAGDILYSQYGLRNHIFDHVIAFTDDGEFISRTSVSSAQYTVQSTGLYKFNINKEAWPEITDINNYTICINRPAFKINPFNYDLINNKEIDDINYSLDNSMTKINYFNIDESIINSLLTANGNIESVTNTGYFTTNLNKCSNGDTFYYTNYNNNTTSNIVQYLKYDSNMHFVERGNVNAKSYTCNYNGYIAFNCGKNSNEDYTTIKNNVIITKNLEVNKFYPYGKIPKDEVEISKIDDTNFKIKFGDYKITLFYNENSGTNSHNWNIKVLTDKKDNVIIPLGTDIIGPVRINNNDDFVGGVHGDERTDNITVSIDNKSYNITDIKYVSGHNLIINMKSTIYDEFTKDKMFDRYITLIFSKNKLHISNNYKAYTNLTLNRATNGGLIACQNPIIKDVMLNNAYYNSAPTTTQSIASKENTEATINTIYGSITVRNIKGYTNPNYSGWLQVFTTESPMRNKIYFDTYKNGSYSILANEVIAGEFEYILS